MKIHLYKERLKKKALSSNCRYKIAAFLFNKRNELVGMSTNQRRLFGKGKGLHAERLIMSKHKCNGYILLGRVNNKGKFLKIEPCNICNKIAKKLGVKIISII